MSISRVFCALSWNPREHGENKIIDLAFNNKINFEMMVCNNQRHKVNRDFRQKSEFFQTSKFSSESRNFSSKSKFLL